LDQWLLLDQLGHTPRANREDLLLRVAIEAIGTPLPRDGAQFALTATRLRERAAGAVDSVLGHVGAIVTATGSVVSLLERAGPEYSESIDDVRRQVEALFRGRWLLEEGLASLAVDWQGLEARLTRMLGGAPAKDLAKLERWEDARGRVRDVPPCPCGEGHLTVAERENRDADNRLRLAHFAPEWRARRG
jgi:hypothetical protein